MIHMTFIYRVAQKKWPPKHSAINLKIFIAGICSLTLLKFNIFWTWCLNFSLKYQQFFKLYKEIKISSLKTKCRTDTNYVCRAKKWLLWILFNMSKSFHSKQMVFGTYYLMDIYPRIANFQLETWSVRIASGHDSWGGHPFLRISLH